MSKLPERARAAEIEIVARAHPSGAASQPRTVSNRSAIRVHDDHRTDLFLRQMGARGLTIGNHVLVGTNPPPSTIRHELAHARQPMGTITELVGSHTSAAEREARSAEEGGAGLTASRSAVVHGDWVADAALASRESIIAGISQFGSEVSDTVNDAAAGLDFVGTAAVRLSEGDVEGVWAMLGNDPTGLAVQLVLADPRSSGVIELLRQHPGLVPDALRSADPAQAQFILNYWIHEGLTSTSTLFQQHGDLITSITPFLDDVYLRSIADQYLTMLRRPFLEQVLSLEFLRLLVDELLPVGTGFRARGSLALTFLVPIQLGGEGEVVLDRLSGSTLQLRRFGIGRAGLDTGIGAGIDYHLGGRASGYGVRARGEARLEALRNVQLREVYSFGMDSPWSTLGLVATFSPILTAASVFDAELARIHPEQYLTEREFSLGTEIHASADGELGVTGLDQLIGGETAPAGGRREQWDNVAQPSAAGSVPWYWRLGLLSASIHRQLGLDLDWSYNLQYSPVSSPPPGMNDATDLELSFEANMAVNLPLPLPILSQISAGGGAGIKLRTRGYTDEHGEPQFTEPTYHLLLMTGGDIDHFTGSASETEVQIFGPGADETLPNPVQLLLRDWRRKERISLPFGLAMAEFMIRFRGLWKPGLRSLGASAESMLEYEAQFVPSELFQIVERWWGAYLSRAGSHDPSVLMDQVRNDVVTWMSTGDIPESIETLAETLLEHVAVQKLVLTCDVSAGAGLDVRGAAGGKLRIAGDAALGRRFLLDLLAEGPIDGAKAVRLVVAAIRSELGEVDRILTDSLGLDLIPDEWHQGGTRETSTTGPAGT